MEEMADPRKRQKLAATPENLTSDSRSPAQKLAELMTPTPRSLELGMPASPALRVPVESERVETEELALVRSSGGGRAALYDIMVREDTQLVHPEELVCAYHCRSMVKREVLDNLAKSEDAQAKLEASLAAERADRERAELDRTQLAEAVRDLEEALAAAEEKLKTLQEIRATELKEGEKELREEMMKAHNLQMRLNREIALRTEAESAARASAAKAAAVEGAEVAARERATRELQQVKAELEAAKEEAEEAAERLQAELVKEKGMRKAAESEVESNQKSVNAARAEVAELLTQRSRLECELAEASANAHMRRPDTSEASELIIKSLRDELARNQAEVAEARHLKGTLGSLQVLRERLSGAEARADRAEQQIHGLHEARLEISSLKQELEAWQATAEALPGVKDRLDLEPAFRDLQRSLASHLLQVGEAREKTADVSVALSRAKSARREAETALQAAEGAAGESKDALRRADRKIHLLTMERDGLKAILDAYDNEPLTADSQAPSEEAKALKARVQQLENELSSAREHAKDLEVAAQAGAESSGKERRRAEGLQKEVDEAWKRNKALEREVEQLGREVALLESKVGRGDYNRLTTKVLHLSRNPESEAHSQLAEKGLQAEVEELRRKVQQLEQAKASSPGSASQPSSEEIAQLTKRITSLEKREARYKNIFAEKISTFREACYFIFGFKVNMSEVVDPTSGSPTTHFSLHSTFADTEREELLFQYREGQIEMLETEYSKSPELSRQVATFLRRFHSIPAFTANLTMELFNKHTLS